MPVVENLPDLSHWKTVQEFSITRAALLLAELTPMIMQMVLRELEVLVMNVGKWLGEYPKGS